jgi:FtsZ-binding cell division protein ZapB
MEYNFTNLTPATDYQELLTIVSERKQDLEFKRMSLKRKQQNAQATLIEIESSSETLAGEIEQWQDIIDQTLSDVPRDDAIYQMARLEFKLLVLRRRQQAISAVSLICYELDIECVARQIGGLNEFSRKLEKHMREV